MNTNYKYKMKFVFVVERTFSGKYLHNKYTKRVLSVPYKTTTSPILLFLTLCLLS